MKETPLLGGRILVTTGDITRMNVDAVVNAANSSLMGGGGVDGAIHRAGGPEILAECTRIRAERYPGGLPAGDAAVTTGGKLPARYVIHTVGPVWRGGSAREAEILGSCYGRCLEEASRLGLATIAFPAISTGVYGFPKDRAAAVVWTTLQRILPALSKPEKVFLVFFSATDADLFLRSSGAS